MNSNEILLRILKFKTQQPLDCVKLQRQTLQAVVKEENFLANDVRLCDVTHDNVISQTSSAHQQPAVDDPELVIRHLRSAYKRTPLYV